MDVLRLILSILYLLICIALVIIVLIQESKSGGMSVINGEQNSFFSTKKGKNKESVLSQTTIILGCFFAVVALILGAIFTFANF